MRSRGFAIAMALVCGGLLVACIALLLRALRLRERREALPRAVQAYRDGDLDKALSHLQQAMANEPERLDLAQFAGTLCLKLKRPEQAREHFARVRDASSGPDRAQWELRLALMALGGGGATADVPAAIEHLRAARLGFEQAKAQEQLAATLLLLADAYQRAGALANADACIDQLAALPPKVLPPAGERVVALRRAAEKVGEGGAASLAEAYAILRGRGEPAFAAARPPIALALALHAGDAALTEPVRRLCLEAMGDVSQAAWKTHGLRLRLAAAAGWSVLGEKGNAVAEARKARDLAPKDPLVLRVLASACLAAAPGSPEVEALRAEGLGAWRAFMAEAKVPPQEQRQVCLALASQAWNDGRKDEARQLLDAFGLADSPHGVRMAAIAALEKPDPPAALKHLRRLAELEGQSPQLADHLKPFTAPPEVSNLRVNRLSRYDARPILIAQFTPRAIGATIAPEGVAASLDGAAIQPIITRAELFYRPSQPLAQGAHKLEVAVTDSAGLKAEKSFAFTIEADDEPPAIIGITPEPDSTTTDQFPLVSFRCTDASGIAPSSLFVVFSFLGEGGKRRDFTIISQGIYQVAIKGSRVKVAKGTHADFGVVHFEPSQALLPGKYRVHVSVEDIRGNKCVKDWTFQCAP